MALTARPTAQNLVNDRLRALLAAGLPGGTRPIHTALLLLNTATGREELRLYSPVADGPPGHQRPVYRLTAPHSAFARDLIAALHAYRVHAWRPERDAYMPSQTDRASRRATDQVGWVLDLRHLQRPPGDQPRPDSRRTP
ncbi:hypothetical protein ACODT3_42770 [Streptomyces sp. 4.24]|uniref:hypothetical protein n=1 Tax=Streptomyces tritrimontium TaxID=3406573 RepID=UPI003BB59FCB